MLTMPDLEEGSAVQTGWRFEKSDFHGAERQCANGGGGRFT